MATRSIPDLGLNYELEGEHPVQAFGEDSIFAPSTTSGSSKSRTRMGFFRRMVARPTSSARASMLTRVACHTMRPRR
jgi:hypothetical protein